MTFEPAILVEEYYGPSEPVKSTIVIKFRPEWESVVLQELNAHGCLMEENDESSVIIDFPEGTIKREVLPRARNVRHEIFLPDGALFREIVPRLGNHELVFHDLKQPE